MLRLQFFVFWLEHRRVTNADTLQLNHTIKFVLKCDDCIPIPTYLGVSPVLSRVGPTAEFTCI